MILQVRDLSKFYGDVVALAGVTCEIGEGATGILGPNGAGKTTLLRILLGLLPAKGDVSIFGLDPMRSPRDVRARIGYMPESECIIPGLPAIDVVAYVGRLAGMPRRDAFKRAHEVITYVGLEEERYRDATGFSVGMQQRLKLATALVHDPQLLLLDEPTNGLDPAGREDMIRLIREMVQEHGKHLLLSSHLLPDVEQVCTEVVMLRGGRVAQTGTIEELTVSQGDVYALQIDGDAERVRACFGEAGIEVQSETPLRVLLPDGADTTLIFKAALAADARVRGLEPVRRRLEDVFLAAVEESDAG